MYPLKKGKYPKQAHLNIPEGTYEEEHARNGFFGKVSQLYRLHPPTSWNRIEGNLKPRAYNTNKLDKNELKKILYNQDFSLFIYKLENDMNYYFRNADADEVLFVHDGEGKLQTDYGQFTYTKGDYIVLPRGTTHRILIDKPSFFLLIESYSEINQPERNLLGPNALYDPSIIETPEPEAIIDDKEEWEVKIKRLNEFTSVFYPYNPIDVIGWKGTLTPWKFNIKDFCPPTCHRSHLPPSVYTTFLAKNFIICSFVPRPLETEEGAIKVPFFHSNIDFDEVIFYHDGDFFSRAGIDAGMITFHPQGIHHGPHPKAIEKSKSKTFTNEFAVMIDAKNPLFFTDTSKSIEWQDYHLSWK